MLFLKLLVTCMLLSLRWAAAASQSLVIQVAYPGASDIEMTLEGDGCGLQWNNGVPLQSLDSNHLQTNLTCDATDKNTVLQIKARLSSNGAYQIGGNVLIDLSNLFQQHTNENNTVIIYPYFKQTQGTIDVSSTELYSPELDNNRGVVAYLPPSYYENTLKQYKTLIMHDGQNLFDPSTTPFGVAWMCQNSLDGMINAGQMDEVIVIGLYNTDDRNNEYTYSYDAEEGFGGKGDLYLDFIENEVFGWIEQSYRVLPITQHRDHVAILGSSLGGLISCYAGWTRSAVYGQAGCMSSSFWWNDEDFLHGVMENVTMPSPALNGIYLDSGGSAIGSQDDMSQTRAVRDTMEERGYVLDTNLFYYWDKGGQHTESSWGNRFYVPLGYLFPMQTHVPK